MRLIIFHLLILCHLSTLNAQLVDTIPEDRSVVYFMRPSLFGGIFGFILFDGDKVIGRIIGGKYFKYECTPGEHVFWAKSENRNYIRAHLEPGKIYIIEPKSDDDFPRPWVRLKVINPKTDKLKRFQRQLVKKDSDDLSEEKRDQFQNQLKKYISRRLQRFENMESRKGVIIKLRPEMYFSPDQLKYQKKVKQKKKKSKRKRIS